MEYFVRASEYLVSPFGAEKLNSTVEKMFSYFLIGPRNGMYVWYSNYPCGYNQVETNGPTRLERIQLKLKARCTAIRTVLQRKRIRAFEGRRISPTIEISKQG